MQTSAVRESAMNCGDHSSLCEIPREDLATLWKSAVSVPLPKAGCIQPAMRSPDGLFVTRGVTVSWESHDVEANNKPSFEKTYLSVQEGGATRPQAKWMPSPAPPVMTPATKAVSYTSPTGSRRVTFAPATDSNISDILIRLLSANGDDETALCISAASVHGPLLPSPFYQHVAWNGDESAIAYVAERCKATVGKTWDTKNTSTSEAAEDPAARKSAFEAKPNFGETMRDFSNLSIFYCNFETKMVREIVPKAFAEANWLTNPVFVGNASLWFTAAPYFPERLGLAHCATRPNTLYRVVPPAAADSEPSEPSVIPYPDTVSTMRCLRAAPDGNCVVGFAPAKDCKAHSCCNALYRMDSRTLSFECLVPEVDEPCAGWCANDGQFPGFYSCTGNDLWFVSNTTLLVQSPRRSACVLYIVALSDGLERPHVTLLDLGGIGTGGFGNWSVLDVRDGLALLSFSTALHSPAVYLWDHATNHLSIVDDAPQRRFHLNPKHRISSSALRTDVIRIPDAHDTEVLFHHRCDGGAAEATVLFVHGGPHASDSNAFMPSIWFLLQCGFQVASVNYGGSTGFGQRRIAELLGRAGVNDVSDCIKALDVLMTHPKCIASPSLAQRVIVSGGSHGGFLTAHLSARYPQRFCAALLRNPVINMASMLFETDIPDWCLAEAGVGSYGDVTSETIGQNLFAQSPIVHVGQVRCATVVGLGLDDLRVPIAQGRSWFTALRRCQDAAGWPTEARPETRLLEYSGTGHAMDAPQATADFHLQAVMMIQRVFEKSGWK